MVTDPVELDQVCYDLIGKKNGDTDPFLAVYPGRDSSRQLMHAEKMGVGNRRTSLFL